MDVNLAKKVAIEAAKEAGKVLNENFHKVKASRFKGERDLVTEVDAEVEKIILDLIKKNFSEHAILSEEAGFKGSDSAEYMWVVDPIDGTMNYYYGMNPYRVGICFLEKKKPILNILYNPTKDELCVAQKGEGAFLNDKKIRVSETSDLKNAIVMLHLSSKKEPRMRTMVVMDRVFEASMQVRMFGSSLASMSYIAGGKFDVYFNVQQKPWDILPGALLIEEAGGKVTDINGSEITHESTSVIASNGKVHEQMVKLLENI